MLLRAPLSKPTDSETPDCYVKSSTTAGKPRRKKISLFLYGGSSELYAELIDNFPKLVNGGGYDLLRQGGNRQLEVIPIPPMGIKNVVYSAKVYIRPLQVPLDMSASPCDVRTARKIT